jgi:acid stress chaperone HdeB
MSLKTVLAAAAILVATMPVRAEILDLSTMSCKQFVESGPDGIKMVLTWLDGWYSESDDALIDTDTFEKNAKKFGAYCGTNPTHSIITAAEKILGG